MDKSAKLTVVMPAYNEAQVITKVIGDLKEKDKNYEIIVVDDGSTDNTYELARQTGVKVVRHLHNKGYGAALKTGIRHAETDFICIMDADGQHRAEDVERLFREIENSNYDMVVGVRTGKSHFPISRRFGKFILKLVANYLAERKIPDLNSGFRIFKKGVVNKFMHILPNGFSFTTTITLALIKEGYEIAYVPITTLKRTGKSTVKPIKHGIQTLLLVIRIITLFDPLKIFLPISIFLIAIGGIYLAYGVIIYRNIPESSMIAILLGVMFFFLGILSDQVSNLRRQHRE